MMGVRDSGYGNWFGESIVVCSLNITLTAELVLKEFLTNVAVGDK